MLKAEVVLKYTEDLECSNFADTKGGTELLSQCAIQTYNAQKKGENGEYSVVQEVSNEPKMKIIPKKFIELQPGA